MNWILRRLQEPSTWRGLVWLATVAGLSLRPEQAEAIVTVGMALAGLLGVFLVDSNSPQLPPIELVGRSDADPLVDQGGAGAGHAGAGVDVVQPVDFVRPPMPTRSRAEPDTRPNLGGFKDRD